MRSNRKISFTSGAKKKSIKKPDTLESKNAEPVRLNKFIAHAGVCSRRDADTLIASGKISVNGKTIKELGHKVFATDIVKYNGNVLKNEKEVYILLNKPKDCITTMDDPQKRNTVMNLVVDACKERVYPVGRLDRNTTGLLLLTNNGDLAKKLSHPSFKVKKIYSVTIDKPITEEDFNKIKEGIQLEDGIVKVDDVAIVESDGKTIGIDIHIGKNRIVRRIFEHLNYKVVRLDRVSYANLTKKDLPRGKWRFLKEKEIINLKNI